MLEVLALLLTDNDELVAWIVHETTGQAALDEIQDVENVHNDFLVNATIIRKVLEIRVETLDGLVGKRIGWLGEHNTHVNTVIHSKAHDALEGIRLTALDLAQKQTGLGCVRAFN